MPAVRKKVTLTLDADIYEATREVLATLPGSNSISRLVDQVLLEFVTTAAPVLREILKSESALERIKALKVFHADTVASSSAELTKSVRALEVLDKKGGDE